MGLSVARTIGEPERLPLFDPVNRTDPNPSYYAEPEFRFLSRVPGPWWDHVRQLMQSWADHVQDDGDYKDLRNRLRSSDDDQYRSAYFELYLHESLIRAGFQVTVHPSIPGSSRHPDFLAEREDQRLYLEAIVPGTPPLSKAANRRRAILFDTVNRLHTPNFLLALEHLVDGPRDPASARLRHALGVWLKTLDPDTITTENAPSFQWENAGWSVGFKPIPLRPDARGVRPGDRAIGIFGHTGARVVNEAATIVSALGVKHNAYGVLDAPLLIAVGLQAFSAHTWDSANAFYGPEVVRIRNASDGIETVDRSREMNGYFGSPPDWGHRQVSGVVVVNQLGPYKPLLAQPTTWLHPGALYPLRNSPGLPGSVMEAVGDQVVETSAIPSADFFDLPDPWPPGDPWGAP
ncbi:hypothetical protein NVV95_17785 [Herbiconiux sp. CPCC 205716]|uniref:Uncharacterized protein n=1 Tax=Herbiconiux gentiana TaxID=2970912 RepID=A0ABT2GLC3_9MICO|nr:hypothetical protein [Herbiconiux gentiana]MCS5716402.1 hypothetical protein [Herbiconiux gentiana]